MSFPKDFKFAPSTSSRYLKFVEEKTRFRILSDMIYGWEGWKDKKPVRAKTLKELPILEWDDGKLPREFFAMVAWDRRTADKKKELMASVDEVKQKEGRELNPVKILELTQASIYKPIFKFENNPDWGDSKDFDIEVTKSGEGIETRYSVMPIPHKALTPDIMGALKAEDIDLGALYDGGNPFGDKQDGADVEIDPDDLPF